MDSFDLAAISGESHTHSSPRQVEVGREIQNSIKFPESHKEPTELEPQILLILVGLPGSGKTTFAESLVEHSSAESWAFYHRTESISSPRTDRSRLGHRYIRRRWIRASQDDAPSRRRKECEDLVKESLDKGRNVIVDRVDFDTIQRSHFINIALASNPKPRIYGLVFQVSIPTLEMRLTKRVDHPTLKDAGMALRVLGQMQSQFHPPRSGGGEGFDKFLIVHECEQPLFLSYMSSSDQQREDIGWTEDQVIDLLERIEVEGVEDPKMEGIAPALSGRASELRNQGGTGRGIALGRGYGGDRQTWRRDHWDQKDNRRARASVISGTGYGWNASAPGSANYTSNESHWSDRPYPNWRGGGDHYRPRDNGYGLGRGLGQGGHRAFGGS